MKISPIFGFFIISALGLALGERFNDQAGPRGGGGPCRALLKTFLQAYCSRAEGNYGLCRECMPATCLQYVTNPYDPSPFDQCIASHNRCCTRKGLNLGTVVSSAVCYASGWVDVLGLGQLSVAATLLGAQGDNKYSWTGWDAGDRYKRDVNDSSGGSGGGNENITEADALHGNGTEGSGSEGGELDEIDGSASGDGNNTNVKGRWLDYGGNSNGNDYGYNNGGNGRGDGRPYYEITYRTKDWNRRVPYGGGPITCRRFIKLFLRSHCPKAEGNYALCGQCMGVTCLQYLTRASDPAPFNHCITSHNRCCTRGGISVGTALSATSCYATGAVSEVGGGHVGVIQSALGGQNEDYQKRKRENEASEDSVDKKNSAHLSDTKEV